jgi:tetratricopeptide (TPR) repeat protein
MQDQLQAIHQLIERREIKKAEILIAKSLRADLQAVEQAELLIHRSRARLLSARPEDAVDDLMNARSLLGEAFDTPPRLELLADCYFARFELSSVGFADRNDAEQARLVYEKIVETFPDYDNLGWVYYQLGRVFLTDNQIDEAVDHFQKALLSPSYLSALTAYCYERMGFVAFYERRDLSKAIALLNKAVDTYPASEDRLWLVQLHILRSRVLRDLYKFDQALQAAEAALSAASAGRNENKLGLAEALFTAGELLSKLEGRERDVVNYLQQFLQHNKKPLGVDVTWSRVHEMLGDALLKLGQYEDAAHAYLAALQYNPYHPWEVSVYYRIARCYYQKRQYDKVVEAINRMLQAAQAEGQDVVDYHVYDILGSAEFALGHYDKAIAAYRAALKNAPPNSENLDKIRTYYGFAQELSQQPL